MRYGTGPALESRLKWARRCRIEPFVKLARTVTYYRQDIEATPLHGVNNARSKSANTKIRLIARRPFGFHSAKALIALSELTLGGLCPSFARPHVSYPRMCQKTPNRPTADMNTPACDGDT